MTQARRPLLALAATTVLALSGAGAAYACDGTGGTSPGTYPGTYPGDTSSSSTTTSTSASSATTSRTTRKHARRARSARS